LAVAASALLWLAPQAGRGGWVEHRDGKTIIHLKLASEVTPQTADTRTISQAGVAAARLFGQRFGDIFREKYRDKYKANLSKYGDHDWDDVEVRLHAFSGLQFEGKIETDLLAIAGDMAPDVLYVNFRKSETYIQNGFLYPLDKAEDGYITGMSAEAKDQRIHPKIWPVIRRFGPNRKEHVWAIPYSGALGKVLLYRKDLFDEHDIPYPDNDWTWDDLFAAAKQITDPRQDRSGILLSRGVHESWYWVTFLWSAGGEVMVYDRAKDAWRTTFDSREAAKALDFYIRLSAERWIDSDGKVRRGYSTKDAGAISDSWEQGKVAMRFAYIEESVLQRLNPAVTGMVPVPLGPPDEDGRRVRGGELNSRMLGLFSGIKHPAVRDAAWEYIRFVDSHEARALRTKIMVEGGLGRFINPKRLEMFGYGDLVRLSPKGWAETFDIAIETGRPEPYGRGSNLAYNMMTYPIQEAEQMLIDGVLPEDEHERLDVLQAILHRWNTQANEKMIGIIPANVQLGRRITAWIALALIVATFAWVFRKVFKVFTPPAVDGSESQSIRWGFRRYWLAYLLLLPAVLTILIWQYAPLARGSVMAFQDYNVLGGSTWVWVDNFGDLLWDFEEHGWWSSVWNSIRYSALVVGLTFLPPIILAILLQEVPVGTLFFRTIFYLPAVITGLVTVLLWKMFYRPNEFGTLNRIVMAIPAIAYLGGGLVLLACCLAFARRLWFHGSNLPALLAVVAGVVMLYTCVGLAAPILFPADEPLLTKVTQFVPRLFQFQPEPLRWLSDRRTAMLSCVIPMVWAGMGPGCLIYLAALKGVSDDYYEAADIDGATFVDKILFVVFPILKPLIIINFVGVFIGSWQSSANILAMTGGDSGTLVADLKIFFEAFTFLKMGPATAMAWVLGFMLIGFTVYQLRILSRLEFKTTGDKT
jgi:ABC-type sugar transport system permease subunit/ABC-type glycerol-3-phosphate transport system substrate-binding protein